MRVEVTGSLRATEYIGKLFGFVLVDRVAKKELASSPASRVLRPSSYRHSSLVLASVMERGSPCIFES